jgi:2-keto-4-pentenoate hydratase/2-oxohepta-3-ene-1,7-dioic acid hydratase in catechol pathway
LLNYGKAGVPAAGILLDDGTVLEAAALLGCPDPTTVEDLLERGPEVQRQIARELDLNAARSNATPLKQLELLSPVLRGQVFIAGSNYRDHIQEMHQRDLASGLKRDAVQLTSPYFALKGSRACLVGSGARVQPPPGCLKFDWEAELAVIIGSKAENVPAERALEHVAGYAIANDLSARDLGRRTDAEKGTTFWVDWVGHKSFAGSAPLGPWITPREAISDPQALSIQLWVNDQVRQDSSTAHMIFGVAEQIAALSSRLPLYPGDVILTGTPAGTATSHGGAYLKRGDVVKVRIEGLGELVTVIS